MSHHTEGLEMDHESPTRLEPQPVGQWLDICALDDVPRQGARVVRRARGADVALFRSAAGAVFALLDRCPHKGGPLSQGIVYGERVACPLHNWSIGLADGEALAPDVGCTRRFAVRIEAGRVWLDAAELRIAD
jgi:nitrite reductase (NADH) small subunit